MVSPSQRPWKYKLSFVEIDCDDNPSLADKYNIDSYPTIILLKDDQKYIFDAAAIGQLIGGVDPRNAGGDTRGFVNETCVIKYKDEGEIIWKMIDGFNKPFIKIDAREVPIFNLHIHCKDLASYT